jgi:hypothetical protein
MGRVALRRLVTAGESVSHEVSKLAWLMIFGMAVRSFGCWIDDLT